MGLPRIFIQHPLKTGILLELEEAPAHHLTRVLRLDTGSEVSLFNGDGREYRSRLTRIGRGTAQVEVLDRSDPEQPPRLPIHLGLGLSKGERMDLAVQKSVELGVTAITPLITDRCVVRLPPQRMAKREEHWRGIIFSACGQSGRNLIPNLHPACSLEAWLKTVDGAAGLLLDHRSSHTLDQLQEPPAAGLSLLAGPEGGLSDKERSMATDAGFTGIRLGPRVLRTETAPLAAIAAVQMLWGDFR